MKWPIIEAQQYCVSVRDGTHNTPKPQSTGKYLITSKHIKTGKVKYDEAYYISENDYDEINKRSKVDKWDVLITMIGAYVGEVCIVDSEPDFAIKNLGLYKCCNEINGKWLYYYLDSPFGQAAIQSLKNGSSQSFISLGALRKLPVIAPPPPIQRAIVLILSAYDDLIANNLRRIALLEETARLLYQEWFVRFQFPGYEHTKMVDGVPIGWNRVPVGDALILQRGFDLPIQSRQEGVFPIFASTGINGYHNIAKVQGPGIVTGRSGTLGMVHYINDDFWPLNTTLWVKEFKLVTPLFAYFLLSELKLSQYNGGVSVPTLDRKVVHRISTVVPPDKIQTLFREAVSPIFLQVQNLILHNQKLKQARNLLLPKLMSGEVMV